MARTSMAALITQTRTLIGDTDTFSDDAIQDALDRHRTEQRLVPLQSSPTFQPGGAVHFQDFYANIGAWESDVLLQDIGYTTVTPDVAEEVVGHWHFASPPRGFSVRATGKTYDLYGSAADLLESWAALVKLEFDVTADKDVYSRSQKAATMLQLAAEHRKRALVSITVASQNSYTGTNAGPAVTYPTYADDWS